MYIETEKDTEEVSFFYLETGDRESCGGLCRFVGAAGDALFLVAPGPANEAVAPGCGVFPGYAAQAKGVVFTANARAQFRYR